MKVKVHNKTYDGVLTPVMIILTDKDKESIKNMHSDSYKYCQYPSDKWSEEEIKEWMDALPGANLPIKDVC